MADKVMFFGARGSVPVEGEAFSRYGGATACVAAQLGGQALLFDAGSGAVEAGRAFAGGRGGITILLSHPHVDHVMGFPFFSPLGEVGRRVDVYMAPRGGLGCRALIDRLIAPPLWPMGTGSFAADVHYHDAGVSFSVGGVQVDAIEGNHPGGCTIWRVASGGKSVVYCTDFADDEAQLERLCRFAAGCTLLIYDAALAEEELRGGRDAAHSTWQCGAEVARRCGAGMLRLFHHAPGRTDDELAAWEAQLASPAHRFARRGEVVAL